MIGKREAPSFGKEATSWFFRKPRGHLRMRRDSPGCVSTCEGLKNGDYQSCKSCIVYATCSNGRLYDGRPCPAALVWDDKLKRCEYSSSTCPTATTECVSDCAGKINGDYQSCRGCRVYATCSNGILYDNRPCPAALVWDDRAKRCEFVSTTCDISGTPTTTTTKAPTTNQASSTTKTTTTATTASTGRTTAGTSAGPRCVSDCVGRPDGDYHSCLGCSVFATCSNGRLFDNRPCPSTLVWDDERKRCEYVAATCPLPTTEPPTTTVANSEATNTVSNVS